MKKKSMLYFDARRGPDEEWTRSANLMCFFLRGISFKELYSDPVETSPENKSIFYKMAENAKKLPDDLNVDADGVEFKVSEFFSNAKKDGVFDRCHSLVVTYNNLNPKPPAFRLGELFYTAPSYGTSPKEKLTQEIADVLDVSTREDKLRHFCAPFVSVQKSRRFEIEERQFRDFLIYLGHKNLVDVYRSQGNRDEREALLRAKAAGIFRERRTVSNPVESKLIAATSDQVDESSDVIVMTWPPGNGKHCVNGACCASGDPDTHCSTVVVNGVTVCTMYSDPGQSCE